MRHSQRGITLLESLTALFIMSIGMLAVMTLFIHSIGGRRQDLQTLQTARQIADTAEAAAMERTADLYTESRQTT